MIIGTIAFLTLVVFAGGGFGGFFPADFNKQVKKQVSDAQRVEQVKEIFKQIEKDIKAYNKLVDEIAKEFLELDSNYDATEENYHQLTGELLAERRKTQAQFVEGRLQIKESITEAEWKAIFSEEDQE